MTLTVGPVFFSGGNIVVKGSTNRIDGQIQVAPSGSGGAVITSQGFIDRAGIFQSGSTAIYLGTGQFANQNTPFLVASSSQGPVFSIADQIVGEMSASKFIVTMKADRLSITTPSFVLASTDTGSPSSDYIKLGSSAGSITSTTGAGIYMDGLGIFRAGDPASEYILWDGSALTIAANRLSITTPSFVLGSDTGSPGLDYIKLGPSAGSMVYNSGAGIYMDGFGIFRAGDPAGEYILWDGNTLTVRGAISIFGNTATTPPGMQLVSNPQFEDGLRLWNIYDNNGSGLVTLTVITGSAAPGGYVPNSSGFALKVQSNTAATPGLGGFYAGIPLGSGDPAPQFYRKGSVILWRVVAWIPTGYAIQFASNAVGDDATTRWNTQQGGAASWTTYILQETIGTTGSFSTTGFFYITGPAINTAWYVAVVDAIDINSPPYTFNMIRGPGLPITNPTATGLFINSTNLGFWDQTSQTWKSYIDSAGRFQFLGNSNNSIVWDGSTFSIKAQNYILKTSTITLDSTVNQGTISLFSASAFSTGPGIWADGTGRFRVGDPIGQRIAFDNSALTLSSSVFDFRSPSVVISTANSGSILLGGSSTVATHTLQGGSLAYDIFTGSLGLIQFSLNQQLPGTLTALNVSGGAEFDSLVASDIYVRDIAGTNKIKAWSYGSGALSGSFSSSISSNIRTAGTVIATAGAFDELVIPNINSLAILRLGYISYIITGSLANETHFRPIHSSSRFVIPVGTNMYATN